ncbi:hypothetical protein [Paenibacillus sp. DMB20]|uniref:hypothetical protein n=1 Tax=Paenibacillus sp. DMB20 TaxID=1642570 RepID=UPI00069C86E9|nr:hypothetical protein [Paenibacillus sp. DMB20]
MEQAKKEIILDEIEHWRRGRLLPEQYCDFLENLYNDQHDSRAKNRSLLTKIHQGSLKTWFLGFGFISFICFIGLYFSSFHGSLQITSVLAGTALCYMLARHFRKRGYAAWGHLCAAAGSLLMLAMGALIIKLQGADEQQWVPVLIAICSLTWCLVGYGLSMNLLHYCGLLGWAVLYGKVSVFYRPDVSWIWIELLWVPLSVILIWLCWLLHYRMKRLAQVYFAAGLTLWFMPQVDRIFLRGEPPRELLVWIFGQAGGRGRIPVFVTKKNG